MVHPSPAGAARQVIAASVALVACALAATGAQQAGTAPRDRALDALLARAAETPAGTYVVRGDAVEPAATADPSVVQADVLRGPDRSIRVPIALGADVRQQSNARLRVVSPGSATSPSRVVADAAGSSGPGRLRLVHDFTLVPGEYEIQAVVGHRRGGDEVVATLSKMRLVVPDIWEGALAITPIVVGDAVGTLPSPATASPFTFGRKVLRPATSDRFAQASAINVGFRIFNWKAEKDRPPDLTVDYLFYQQGARHLTFFNKLKQEHLDASTLGSTFTPAAGMVSAGMVVPLVSFPVGEFQLTVRVTDARTKQVGERQVRFSVAR